MSRDQNTQGCAAPPDDLTPQDVPCSPDALDIDLSALPPQIVGPSVAPVAASQSEPAGAPPPGLVLGPPVPDIVCLLDPSLIEPGPWPNRSDDAFSGPEFDELVASIQANGRNSQPITVERLDPPCPDAPPRYRLIAGERRLRACKVAGIRVRAIVVASLPASKAKTEQLLENMNRKDLRPLEFGRQVRRVLAEGPNLKLSDLAKKLGKDKSLLSRASKLAELPHEVLDVFPCAAELTYAEGELLDQALAEDRAAVLSCAEELGKVKPAHSKQEVLQRLCLSVHPSKGTESDGVAPCNAARKWQLKSSLGVRIGDARVTPDGKMALKLTCQLDQHQQNKLTQLVEDYIKSLQTGRNSPEMPRRAKGRARAGKPGADVGGSHATAEGEVSP